MESVLPDLYFPDLPERICKHAAADLRKLVALITGRYRIGRITCFGYRNRHTGAPGPEDPDAVAGHYFILLETRELYPESVIQDYVNNHFTCGKALVLSHHQDKVREMLEAGHRFYFQVRRSGILLFAEEPDPVHLEYPWPDNWTTEADRHFKIHYGMSRSFRDGASEQLRTGQLRIALFLLHQTMEQACIGLIRVYLGYRANFHNLGRLLELCSCFIGESADLFPAHDREGRRLLKMLCRSYTEARYREEFAVSPDDCQVILHAVTGFIRQTEEHCLGRLRVLGGLADPSNSG